MREGLQNVFGRRGRAAAALVLTLGALFGFRLDLAEAAGRWLHALTCCCPHEAPERAVHAEGQHPCEGHAAEAEPEPAVGAAEGCGCAAPVLFAGGDGHDGALAPTFGLALNLTPASCPVAAAGPWTAAPPVPPTLPPDWRPPPPPDLLSSIVILS